MACLCMKHLTMIFYFLLVGDKSKEELMWEDDKIEVCVVAFRPAQKPKYIGDN